MDESASTASTLQAFKAVADNALTRSILKILSKNCARDKGNRLEVALKLYVGTRNDACASCRLSRAVLSPIKQLADFVGGCGAGRFYICLEPNGDIYPCVFFPHEPAMRVGNLLKDDFEQIWRHSQLFWEIREKD